MRDLKGLSWFTMNNKLILLISEDCKNVPIIMSCCNCELIICSNATAKKHRDKFINSGAKIISF